MAEVKELSEADVLAMAMAHDEGRDWQPPGEPAKAEQKAETAQAENNEAPPALPTETETKTSSSEGAVEKEAKATETTSTSSLTTTDESKSDAASVKEERKPSRYEKAKSRLEKEWEDLRAEKARLAAEREAIQAKAGQAGTQTSQEASKKSSRRFSAEDYREAAKSYRNDGNDDMAKAAEAKAAEIEEEDRRETETRTQAELKSAWDQNLLKEVESNPELRDSSTKLYKAVGELLQQHAILRNYPAGISDAVGLAKLRIKAEAASDLEKRLKDAEAELGRLRKATTPAASQPLAPAKIKTFDEMSSEEQGRELLRMAMEADRN
jgi:site-specific DNA-cytosine methylase